MTKYKRSLAFISDIHAGSAYGLFPPSFRTKEGNIIEANSGQRALYAHWSKIPEILEDQEVDTIILVGDMIQGTHRKGFGQGNVVVSTNEQAKVAYKLLKPICKGRKVYGVSGTEYHDAKEYRIEEAITTALEGKHYGYILNLDIEGTDRSYNIAHGSSQSMIYRETVAAREVLFAREAEALGKAPHYDAIVRGHNHIFRHLDLPKCHYILNPCWQALKPDNYTLKNYFKYMPDFGFVTVGIDSYDRQHVLHWLLDEPVNISDFMRSG